MRGLRTARTTIALLLVMLVAACSGVPQNSRPQVVRAIDGGQAEVPTAVGPSAGEDPRSIVSGFLIASVLSTSGARQYLTLDAQSKWQPNPVVIVDDRTVGNATAQSQSQSQVVVIPSEQIGQLDASGVYAATLNGDAAAAPQRTFTLKKDANGQWRIDSLQNGILITQSDFSLDYHPHTLYFLDSAERSLIPDQRYSSLTGQQLLSWLMKQILAGPRPSLAASVVNEVPPQVDASHITVTSGDPIKVEMPGVDQSDSNGKLKLAEQLAFTLGAQLNGSVALTDTGRAVSIPTVNGSAFSGADFPTVDPLDNNLPSGQYFLRSGQLVDGRDQAPLPTPVGDPNLNLTSVAVQGVGAADLAVVAVSGQPGGRQKVLLSRDGTAYTVVATLPPGPLSRPEWQPRSSFAWIGVGASAAAIYEINPAGVAKPVSVTPLSGAAAPTGPITNLRFSPDGSRLAAVVSGGSGANSVWVGSVVRSGTNVSIGSFEPITPSTLDVSDLAWRDNLVLYVLAKQSSSAERGAGIWSVSSDGSNLVSLPSTGLPGSPTEIAAGQDDPPIVVSERTLWVLSPQGWSGLGGTTAPNGDSPVYSH